MVDQKEGMVLSHWMLKKEESERHRKVLSQYELMHSGFNPLDSMYQVYLLISIVQEALLYEMMHGGFNPLHAVYKTIHFIDIK